MHDVFISYPRRDRARVEPIKIALEGLGLSCFFDVEGIDAGDQFPDVIDTAVKRAACVLGVWSPFALTRDWVKKECRIGLHRGVLVTAAIEQIDGLEIPTEFGAPHLVDLSTFTGNGSHRGFIEVIKAVSEKCGRTTLYALAATALAQPDVSRGVANEIARPTDVASLRATWDDLKGSKNVDRVLKFRDEHAKGTLLEFAIEERLEQLASEIVTQAEQIYSGLTRSQMLSNLRNADFWNSSFHNPFPSYSTYAGRPSDKSSASDAFKLYVKAASLSNAIAMGYVAVMMRSGTGTSPSTFEAGKWRAKALRDLG